MKTNKKTILAVAVILLSVIVDQATKSIAQSALADGSYVGVFGDAIGFELVHNPGAFLGMFSDARWAFMLPSMVIIAVMTVWLFVKRSPSNLFIVSVCLLIGGGIANMIDRIFLGYVVDFIALKFINFPMFNVADSCVTIGCVLFGVCALFTKEDVFDLRFFPAKSAPVPSQEEGKRDAEQSDESET